MDSMETLPTIISSILLSTRNSLKSSRPQRPFIWVKLKKLIAKTQIGSLLKLLSILIKDRFQISYTLINFSNIENLETTLE